MRIEEYSKSPQDLQKKFREWFGDGIPTHLPFPAEADCSIRDPVPAVLPLSNDADHLDPRTGRRVNNPQKLFWL